MIKFTDDEKEMIVRLAEQAGIEAPPFEADWPEDVVLAISEASRDFEVLRGLNDKYEPTREGLVAISVGDKLESA